MIWPTEEFQVNGRALTVSKAHDPSNLGRCLQDLQQELREEAIANYGSRPSSLSHFFRADKGDEKLRSMRVIMYTNGDPMTGVKSLIMTNGKDHYYYNLNQGSAATEDVKLALGDGLVDVSGRESRANFEEAFRVDEKNAVMMVREKSAHNLPKHDLSAAIAYAMQQIKLEMKKAVEKPELVSAKRFVFGSGTNSAG